MDIIVVACDTVSCFLLPVGMLTDIRINPDNKLSGYIRIINYLFNPLKPTVAIRALWLSGLSVRVPECQKLQMTA